MRQSKNINRGHATDTEYHKMPPLTPLAGDMKGQDAIANLIATLCTQNLRPPRKLTDRQ